MAKAAVNDGIKALVATPHWNEGVYDNHRECILSVTRELQERLARSGIPLKVYPGSELRLHPTIPHGVRSGRLMTINDTGRYLLLELPPTFVAANLNAFLFEVQSQGVTPVLAHPERNPVVMHHPEYLEEWVRCGVLVQITAESLLGGWGKDVQRFSIKLLEKGLVHIMASDAHNSKNRPPKLRQASLLAAGLLGEEAARDLVEDVPSRILKGEPVLSAERPSSMVRRRKPSLWKRILEAI